MRLRISPQYIRYVHQRVNAAVMVFRKVFAFLEPDLHLYIKLYTITEI